MYTITYWKRKPLHTGCKDLHQFCSPNRLFALGSAREKAAVFFTQLYRQVSLVRRLTFNVRPPVQSGDCRRLQDIVKCARSKQLQLHPERLKSTWPLIQLILSRSMVCSGKISLTIYLLITSALGGFC